MSDLAQRHAARVIVLDDAGRVLLIRFVVDRSDGAFAFWATPGGEIEAGETEEAAAARELVEETGVVAALTGPVHRTSSVFDHDGRPIESHDVFFLARCAADAPVLTAHTDAERAAFRDMRWWSVDAIDAAIEPIFPHDLAPAVRRVRNAPWGVLGSTELS